MKQQKAMKLGQIIYKLREERGLSQRGLADAIGVSSSLVGHWEANPTSVPSLQLFVKLSDFFHVSADYLLMEDRKVNPSEFIDNNKENSLETNQLNTLKNTFLQLTNENKYILIGNALELLKEQNQSSASAPFKKKSQAL